MLHKCLLIETVRLELVGLGLTCLGGGGLSCHENDFELARVLCCSLSFAGNLFPRKRNRMLHLYIR